MSNDNTQVIEKHRASVIDVGTTTAVDVTLATSSSLFVDADVVVHDGALTSVGMFTLRGSYKRAVGDAVLVGQTLVTSSFVGSAGSFGWSAEFDASGSDVRVRVTVLTGSGLDCSAHVRCRADGWVLDEFDAAEDIDGVLCWFRGDTVVMSGSDVVSWTDKTGNGNTVGQGTVASRPSIVSSWRNGKAALSLDGTSDYLSKSNPPMSSSLGGSSKPFTAVWVSELSSFDPETAPVKAVFGWSINTPNDSEVNMGINTDSGLSNTPGVYATKHDSSIGVGRNSLVAGEVTASVAYVSRVAFDGTDVRYYINGSEVPLDGNWWPTGSSSDPTLFEIGANPSNQAFHEQNLWNGKIAELLITNTSASQQIIDYEHFLSTYYGIP